MPADLFMLTSRPIQGEALRASLVNDYCGGFVSFEGWVRNHNENRPVRGLFYQCYPELALHSGQQIVEQALHRFDIEQALCVHRTGQLAIGEMAVWVGVSGAHRQACFEACQYIIDTVKQDVAIWKEEYYADGDTPVWLADPVEDSRPD